MTKKSKIGCLSVSILFIFLFLYTCGGSRFSPFPYCHLAPFFGKVIDADSKEPIAGAAVLAVYRSEVPSIAGPMSSVVDGQETLTDENGEFKIPKVKRWFVADRGYPGGKLIIFKPGYGFFPNHKQSRAPGINRAWPPPNKYIVFELPKLKTRKERDLNLNFTRPVGITYKKMRHFTNLLNKERINLGYSPLTIPREGKK